MIHKIEALNYRCFNYIGQRLNRFQILVGPNSSGKSSFLDVIAFLGDLVRKGLDGAIEQRTRDPRDLVWGRQEERFELAVEVSMPQEILSRLPGQDYRTCRYEVVIAANPGSGEAAILSEKVLALLPVDVSRERQETLLPLWGVVPETLVTPRGVRRARTLVNKVPGGNDHFYDETGHGWDHAFRLGSKKSALGNLPEDEGRFPVATWLKGMLVDRIRRMAPELSGLRKPSPPGLPGAFRADGSNLPSVIEDLKRADFDSYSAWVGHVRTALPDIESVSIVERREDRQRYLLVRYRGGLEVPSWMVSDGTLRFLGLSLLAFLPGSEKTYLIEEPENGIHPEAVEHLYAFLRSVVESQILVTTHSPVVLEIAEPGCVLVFSKSREGGSQIVSGAQHPALRNGRQGDLFAPGPVNE